MLQNIIQKRDKGSNGVSRKENIQLIFDLGGASSDKQVENHID